MTYRIEVYGWLQGIHCHLYGEENLTWNQLMAKIASLTTETYTIHVEAAE